jgi:hypothetical protein
MHILIKYKNVFIFFFIISLCISLYYYFNNYTTFVKNQYTVSQSKVILSINSNDNFTYKLNEKINNRLVQLGDFKRHILVSTLAKNLNISENQVQFLNQSLNYLIDHNYKYDHELMITNLNKFLDEFMFDANIIKDINELIENDFQEIINKLYLLNYFTKGKVIHINKFDNYYELKILIHNNFNALDSFSDELSTVFHIHSLLVDSDSFSTIKENSIILKKPQYTKPSELITMHVHNIKENTILITGYNIFYYVLIIFGFTNILIYLYIYLRQKKYI